MENIVVSSIMNFAREHSMICPEHFCFRNGRSCESELLGLVDEISEDILLTHKLRHYRIAGQVNNCKSA